MTNSVIQRMIEKISQFCTSENQKLAIRAFSGSADQIQSLGEKFAKNQFFWPPTCNLYQIEGLFMLDILCIKHIKFQLCQI